MLIGCRRQFSDVDFLTEHGRSTTTTTPRDGSTYVCNADRVPCGNNSQPSWPVKEGGALQSRVARIVFLCYTMHAAGVGALRFIGCRGFLDVSCSSWVLSVLVLGLEYGAAGAGKIHETICGLAPPAAVCIVRACPAPGLCIIILSILQAKILTDLSLWGMSSTTERLWHV